MLEKTKDYDLMGSFLYSWLLIWKTVLFALIIFFEEDKNIKLGWNSINLNFFKEFSWPIKFELDPLLRNF